ncbi:MAG TPA: hypothetical protein VN802_00055 [Stellaceae bacterium]|nr:hypothetical protein [Stellaceae bacterium]
MNDPPLNSLMPLEDAVAVFRRLGFDVNAMSRTEFRAAYYGLARKYQSNASAQSLMATINAAKASIMGLYDWAEDRSVAAKVERAREHVGLGAATAAGRPKPPPLRDIVRAAMAEHAYLGTRRVIDKLKDRRREQRELTMIERVKAKLMSALRRS